PRRHKVGDGACFLIPFAACASCAQRREGCAPNDGMSGLEVRVYPGIFASSDAARYGTWFASGGNILRQSTALGNAGAFQASCLLSTDSRFLDFPSCQASASMTTPRRPGDP